MQSLANIRTIVTGSTGFVGLRTVSKLLNDTPIPQVALAIRATTQEGAKARLTKLIQCHPYLALQNHLDRIEVLAYDGSSIPTIEKTNGQTYDALLNLGADTDWVKPLNEMMKANFDPLQDMIDHREAEEMPKHVVHCSTAYARPLEAVAEDLVAKEESLPEGISFFSPYGESKYHAERKIESAVGVSSDTRYSIVRPSTVGASAGLDSVPRGWALDLKGLSGYFYLANPNVKLLHTAPVVSRYNSNILSVDHVANTLVAALLENVNRSSPSSIEYIHATPQHDEGLTMEEATRAFNADITIPDEQMFRPKFADMKEPNIAGHILYKICGKPYLFEANKRDTLLKPLLSAEEQKTFPMNWSLEDDQRAYIKDCADVVAYMVAQKAAAKQKQKQQAKKSKQPAVELQETSTQEQIMAA